MFVAELVTSFLLPLTGWFNSIVYGWNRQLLEQVYLHSCKMCCSCSLDRWKKKKQQSTGVVKFGQNDEDSVQLIED